VPETIDERVLNKSNLSHFKIMENQSLCINSAKAVGCNVCLLGGQWGGQLLRHKGWLGVWVLCWVDSLHPIIVDK
jgi:hypothetical protein